MFLLIKLFVGGWYFQSLGGHDPFVPPPWIHPCKKYLFFSFKNLGPFRNIATKSAYIFVLWVGSYLGDWALRVYPLLPPPQRKFCGLTFILYP